MSRPKKKDNERLEADFRPRFTEQDSRRLRAIAAAASISTSELIRRLTLSGLDHIQASSQPISRDKNENTSPRDGKGNR